MSPETVALADLAAQLRAGARRNAYDAGYGHGSAMFPDYRRDALFGDDDELGRRYDAGFAQAESEAADEWLEGGDGYAVGRFHGVFVRAACHDGSPDSIQAAHEFVRAVGRDNSPSLQNL